MLTYDFARWFRIEAIGVRLYVHTMPLRVEIELDVASGLPAGERLRHSVTSPALNRELTCFVARLYFGAALVFTLRDAFVSHLVLCVCSD